MKHVTEQMVLVFRNEWLIKMLSCDEAEFSRAEYAISELYKMIGKKTPFFVRVESPLEVCSLNRNKLLSCSSFFFDIERSLSRKIDSVYSDGLREALFQNIWVFLRMAFDMNETIRLACQNRINCSFVKWDSLIHKKHLQAQGLGYKIAYYLFFSESLDMQYPDIHEPLKIWKEITESIYAWWPYRDVCFLSNRPVVLRESGFRLHSDSLPAVEFRDGNRLYFLNNIPVPEWVVMTPANKIDPGSILRENNDRVVREIIKKIGVERITEDLAEMVLTLDKWKDYELLDLCQLFRNPVSRMLYLRMVNRSTGQVHIEGVSPSCRTCREALSWRIGDIEWKPLQIS